MASPVDTDELTNSAFEAKSRLLAQQPDLDTKRARLASQLPTARGRGQIASLQQQIAAIDRSKSDIDRQIRSIDHERDFRANSAFQNNRAAIKDTDLALHTQVANESANIQRGVVQLQAKYPDRLRDAGQGARFHAEMQDLVDQNRMGLGNDKTNAMVWKISQLHDQETDRNRNAANARLFKETGLSPEQFAAGTNARATNVPVLIPDTTAPGGNRSPTLQEIESKRADNGQSVALDINGIPHLFSRGFFDNLDQTFRQKAQPQSAPVSVDQTGQTGYSVASTPPPAGTTYALSGTDQPSHGGDYWTQPLPGGQIQKNFASGGSAVVADTTTPQGAAATSGAQALTAARAQYLDKNPAAVAFPANLEPGASPLVTPPQTDVIASTNDNRGTTLPAGVQPNAPIQPVQQLGVQPATTPSTAAAAPETTTPIAPQATATPHPMEGQTVRNKQSGVMGTIVNGIFVPNDQQ